MQNSLVWLMHDTGDWCALFCLLLPSAFFTEIWSALSLKRCANSRYLGSVYCFGPLQAWRLAAVSWNPTGKSEDGCCAHRLLFHELFYDLHKGDPHVRAAAIASSLMKGTSSQ